MASVSSLFQKMRWPITGLGLGTPANLALLSPKYRPAFVRIALMALIIGVAAAFLVLGLDKLLFAGVSFERIKAVAALPFGQRVLIILFSAVMEEIVFRLIVSTLVASVTFLIIRRVTPNAAQISIWLGIVVACILFGLAHVANLADVPHPYLRAITLNGVGGLVLGWLYWFRGLEAAVLAHLAADATVYLLVASLL